MSYNTLDSTSPGWTFLSNYSHVLICLANDPMMKMREVALRVGITERAVQRIVAELEAASVLRRTRVGRQNSYEIDCDVPLRHSMESHRTVGDLLGAMLSGSKSSCNESETSAGTPPPRIHWVQGVEQ